MPTGNGTDPIKTALEAIKVASEVLSLRPVEERVQTRAGPLVVIGRFYVSLTLILAIATSAASVLDWKMSPHHPDFSITTLRLGVLVVVSFGLILGVVLLGYLLWRNPGLLFSPTELSTEAQQAMLGPRSKEEKRKQDVTEAPTTPTTVAPTAESAPTKPKSPTPAAAASTPPESED